ncbi:MAG: hypothetical protein RJA70_952, partial [Pseudomonadota bacterium]
TREALMALGEEERVIRANGARPA